MHVVAGGIKLNAGEGEEERRDLEKIIGRHKQQAICRIFLSS